MTWMRRLVLSVTIGLGGCSGVPDCGPIGVPSDRLAKWQALEDDQPPRRGWEIDYALTNDMERYFHGAWNPEVAYKLAYLYGIEERYGNIRPETERLMRADDLTKFAARCGVPEAAHWLSLRYRYGRRGLPRDAAKADCLAKAAALTGQAQVTRQVAECKVPFTGFRKFWNTHPYRRDE